MCMFSSACPVPARVRRAEEVFWNLPSSVFCSVNGCFNLHFEGGFTKKREKTNLY